MPPVRDGYLSDTRCSSDADIRQRVMAVEHLFDGHRPASRAPRRGDHEVAQRAAGLLGVVRLTARPRLPQR